MSSLRQPRRPRSHPDTRPVDFNFARDMALRLCAPLPSQEPFDWCVENVVFADTEVTGPFNPIGREFLRDIINDIDDTENREHTVICATGTGKTTSVMCRHHWTIVHNPRRAIMVMPATKGAGGSETYVTSRFIPSLEATRACRELMPDGQRRLFMNSKKVRLNGSHFDFVGGGSPSAVASNRCSLIEIDELDKLKDKLGNEAGTKKLVDERTEGVKDYTVFQSTTPTVETGQGWKCLLRSDFRRRFLPCPHCNPTASRNGHRGTENTEKNSDSPSVSPLGDLCVSVANLRGWFDLAWSEQYCVLPTKFADGTLVPRAYIKWDDEARRKDGEWDRDRIVRSVRMECPHCQGHIRDEHKIWMDKNGVWIPLQENHGHKGYHLSALYAPPLVTAAEDPTHKSRLAGRALKFLDASQDGEGMKGFINSTLAEVDTMQERGRVEISSTVNFATEDWTALMDCDFQKNWPYLWFTVTKFSSFKLQAPFPLANGKPHFADALTSRPALNAQCVAVVAGHDAAWLPLAEILRFDARTGEFPMLDWLLAQKITGEKLVETWRNDCGMDTLSLGRLIYRGMGQRMPKGGDAEVVAAGHCEHSGDDAWEELRDFQKQFRVGETLRKFGIHPNRAVLVDSGYAENNNPEVLRKCYEAGVEVWLTCPHCNAPGKEQKYGPCCWEWYDPMAKKFSPHRLHQFMRPVPKNSWVPYRGTPTDKPRKDASGIDAYKKWIPGDPFSGLREAEKKTIRVLEAASNHFFRRWIEKRSRQKQIQEAAAAGKSQRGHIWNVADSCVYLGSQCRRREDFASQLNSKGVKEDGEIWERGTGGGGKKRHPDHLLDCASQMAEAHAEALGFFSYERAQADQKT